MKRSNIPFPCLSWVCTMKFQRKMLTVFLLFMAIYPAAGRDYLITDFGARPGLFYLNTEAINNAIVKCSGEGGGRVMIPAGIFKSGTIVMKNNVELHLEIGATLLASAESADFIVPPLPSYRSQKDPGGWRALILC